MNKKYSSKQGNRWLAFLLVPLLLLGSLAGVMQAAPAVETYSLQPFAEDAILKNPNDGATGYFEIYQEGGIVEPAVLDLWYSYSPTTKSELSAITVFVNGAPITSRSLEAAQGAVVNWQVLVPVKNMRSGMNEVQISVVHRSIDGLCRDIDNEANWFIIRSQTRLSFKTNRVPYTLASYPQPFLDRYQGISTNTTFYLPTNADQKMLAAVLDVSSNWGAQGLLGLPKRLEVRLGEPGAVADGNEIVAALDPKWSPGQALAAEDAWLQVQTMQNGFGRLIVSGGSAEGLYKGLATLSRPQLVKTFLGQQMKLSSELPPTDNSKKKPAGKKGVYTLADLGFNDDISLTGAFHQDAVLTVPRPANYNIAEGSYIELHFRHSKLLDPKKSAVTVYVNNIPVKAVALMLENSENGILKVLIPKDVLNQASWQVRFGFYHDIGIVDCSKRYDEVAWSVVEKGTTVVLEPGGISRFPVLDDFPNQFASEGDGAVPLVLVLPSKLSQEEMNLAVKLAYYLGRYNKGRIQWTVESMDTFDIKKASGSVIVLGPNNSAAYWQSLKKYLHVVPTDTANYQIPNWMNVMPESIAQYDICEISRLDENRNIYAFLYENPQRMNRILDFMLSKGNQLSGQVTLLDVQGKTKVFVSPHDDFVGDGLAWLRTLWARIGGTVGMYIAVFVMALVATGVLMLYVRNRPRP